MKEREEVFRGQGKARDKRGVRERGELKQKRGPGRAKGKKEARNKIGEGKGGATTGKARGEEGTVFVRFFF
jgi:hypothetical protein